MTTINKIIQIPKPLSSLWLFLNDPERVGKCLPGCQEVKVLSDSKSYWRVKVSAGIVSKVIEADVWKDVDESKKELSFRIRSKSGDLEGNLRMSLQKTEVEGNSQLNLNFDIRAIGSFSWFINQLIGTQSDKMASQFIECINSSI
jgi:carbon monoxide dehydrogenase subunit G